MSSQHTSVFDDTFWVVRSAGERTTAACLSLIRNFIPAERVRVINERPFTKAIAKAYELGIEADYKWTVSIDADVFVHRPGFEALLAVANDEPGSTFYVQGYTVDKYIPIVRTAGSGIYRTASLPEALKGIPHGKHPLRPETETVQAMIAKGYRFRRSPVVVGMHDFEQHYEDIIRKAYLHVRKHRNVLEEMLTYWRDNEVNDKDFSAALLGHQLSMRSAEAPRVDREFLRSTFATALREAGMDAKPALPEGRISAAYVAEFLAAFRAPAGLQRKKFPQFDQDYYVALIQKRRPPSIPRRVVRKLRRILGV